MYAVIAVPNEASIRFHEAMGFELAGSFPGAGFKLGAWHTIEFWWARLGDQPDAPQAPIPFSKFRDFPQCREILQRASRLVGDQVP